MGIKDLITEEKDGGIKLSLGRVAFWMVFVASLYRIIIIGVIDTSVLGLIGMLLTYGGFKKTKIAGNNANS